jgi:hypothetical protein
MKYRVNTICKTEKQTAVLDVFTLMTGICCSEALPHRAKTLSPLAIARRVRARRIRHVRHKKLNVRSTALVYLSI